MPSISPFESNDILDAYAIEMVSHPFPWSKSLFISNQGSNYLNYKISYHGRMIGFCIIHKVADEASVFNIAIHPTYQRQGMAKLLLNYLIELLKQQQITTLWLEVRGSNKTAIHLYEHLGFHAVTRRPNYYPLDNNRREDAIVMVNPLIFNEQEK